MKKGSYHCYPLSQTFYSMFGDCLLMILSCSRSFLLFLFSFDFYCLALTVYGKMNLFKLNRLEEASTPVINVQVVMTDKQLIEWEVKRSICLSSICIELIEDSITSFLSTKDWIDIAWQHIHIPTIGASWRWAGTCVYPVQCFRTTEEKKK